MSDRLCKLCDNIISTTDENIQIISGEDDGRLVVMERFGLAHILFSERETREHLAARGEGPEIKYEVRQPEQPVAPPQAPVKEEPQPPEFEAITEPEQPIAVEVVEPEAESTAEEFDGYIEEVNSEFGSGFIRVVWQQRRKSLSKVIFDAKDVTTFGEIKVGKMVRFEVVEPDPGRTMHRAKNIRVYIDVGNVEEN